MYTTLIHRAITVAVRDTEAKSLFSCGTPNSGIRKYRTPDSDSDPKNLDADSRPKNQTPTLGLIVYILFVYSSNKWCTIVYKNCTLVKTA